MIFCSVNEKGVPAWKLVLEGRKTVTRRLKPMKVGQEFAVQPNRGKKAVCRARVVSCFFHKYMNGMDCENEANREGFASWEGLLDWFAKKGIDISKTFRIEFKVIKGEVVK